MWLTITTTGELSSHAGTPTAEDINRIVGGYFEAINVPDIGVMWLNEDGKRLRLPANPSALLLARNAGLTPTDVIVGDVVLTGGADDEGETLPLGEHALLDVMVALAVVK